MLRTVTLATVSQRSSDCESVRSMGRLRGKKVGTGGWRGWKRYIMDSSMAVPSIKWSTSRIRSCLKQSKPRASASPHCREYWAKHDFHVVSEYLCGQLSCREG